MPAPVSVRVSAFEGMNVHVGAYMCFTTMRNCVHACVCVTTLENNYNTYAKS